MPRINKDSAWEKGLRASVRASTAKGWSVREDKGRVRLQVRTDLIRGSVTLPFDWTKSCVGDVVARARNIYSLTADGYELHDAALANSRGGSTVALMWRHEFDRAVVVPVVVPIHKCTRPFAGLVLAGKGPAGVVGPVFDRTEQGFRVRVVV
jgi:hypothetical protein